MIKIDAQRVELTAEGPDHAREIREEVARREAEGWVLVEDRYDDEGIVWWGGGASVIMVWQASRVQAPDDDAEQE